MRKSIFFIVSLLYFSFTSGGRVGNGQEYKASHGEPCQQLGVLPGKEKGKGVGTEEGGEKAQEEEAEEAGDLREVDPDAKDYCNPSFLFLNGLCGMKEGAGQGH